MFTGKWLAYLLSICSVCIEHPPCPKERDVDVYANPPEVSIESLSKEVEVRL
jgi:hypothetical protein